VEVKDFVTAIGTFVSALLVVGGWLFARHKDREEEKFRLRQSRREELAKVFLTVDEIILRTSGKVEGNPDFLKKWLQLAGLMRLYGTQDENGQLLRFAEAFMGEKRNVADANASFNNLKATLTSSIRSELGFDPLS
jgi:hypothetical protein